jgi:hypothetical protein
MLGSSAAGQMDKLFVSLAVLLALSAKVWENDVDVLFLKKSPRCL